MAEARCKDASNIAFGIDHAIFFAFALRFADGEWPWFIVVAAIAVGGVVSTVIAQAIAAYVVGRFFPRWELAWLYEARNLEPAALAPVTLGIRRLFELGRAQSRATP